MRQGNSEIANLERECEETLSKARSEAAKLLEAAKSESTKEQQQKMEAAKAVRFAAALQHLPCVTGSVTGSASVELMAFRSNQLLRAGADCSGAQEFDAELKKAEEEIAQEEKDLLSNIDDIVRPCHLCILPAGCVCPRRCCCLLHLSTARQQYHRCTRLE